METRQKKHVLTGCCQTFKVWQPLKQTVTPKASCLYVFDQCILLIFHFSQLPGTFLAQKKHTCFWKLFLTSKHSCKEYFVERKQMNSTTTACSKLWMLGSKTCHVCTQLELQFIPHLFRQSMVCLRTLSNDQVRLEFYITITAFGDHKSKNAWIPFWLYESVWW